MSERKIIRDIMLELFEYPHIPYWFSIEQVIKVMKASFIQSQKHTDPLVVLVFDEKYNLLGTVTPKDILKSITSSTSNSSVNFQVKLEETEFDLDGIFSKESKNLAQKPVSEIMLPAKHFVEPLDSITKAAYLMTNSDVSVLPVIEDKKKLVGIVRMLEIFDMISQELLKKM